VSFTADSKLIGISQYAFASSGLLSITIPASVTSIGSNAFQSCTGLTSVSFADSTSDLRTAVSYLAGFLKDYKISAQSAKEFFERKKKKKLLRLKKFDRYISSLLSAKTILSLVAVKMVKSDRTLQLMKRKFLQLDFVLVLCMPFVYSVFAQLRLT
jgi:hypothetical protein